MMIKALPLAIGVLALAPGAVQAEDDPRALLQQVENAVETLNYEGTFVHIVDGKVDTMYVVHRYENGSATERLVSLDGPRREIIRDRDEVTCIFADEKSVLVERRKQDGPLRAVIPRNTEQLDRHYRFKLLKPVNKLGRKASVLAIVPEDDLRYGYKLWIDQQTSMLLKSQVVDKYGKVLEQLIFVSMELPESIPAERLKPSIAAEDFDWHVQGEEAAGPGDVGKSAWRAVRLPAGFELAASSTGVMVGGDTPTEHLVFTDGMASVSVFIDRAGGESVAPEGPSRIGAANAYTTRVGQHMVTAMGEVPLATVRMIAESVRPRKDQAAAAR